MTYVRYFFHIVYRKEIQFYCQIILFFTLKYSCLLGVNKHFQSGFFFRGNPHLSVESCIIWSYMPRFMILSIQVRFSSFSLFRKLIFLMSIAHFIVVEHFIDTPWKYHHIFIAYIFQLDICEF